MSQTATTVQRKWIYRFEEGNKDMKNLLGGKGANIAEMLSAGLPVPPGFTITTEACNEYYPRLLSNQHFKTVVLINFVKNSRHRLHHV